MGANPVLVLNTCLNLGGEGSSEWELHVLTVACVSL